jgi:hypothetical protein
VTFQSYTECSANKRTKASRLIQHRRNIPAITCPLFIRTFTLSLRSGGSTITATNQITVTGLVYSSNLLHHYPVSKFFTACTAYLYVSGYVQHWVSVSDYAK